MHRSGQGATYRPSNVRTRPRPRCVPGRRQSPPERLYPQRHGPRVRAKLRWINNDLPPIAQARAVLHAPPIPTQTMVRSAVRWSIRTSGGSRSIGGSSERAQGSQTNVGSGLRDTNVKLLSALHTFLYRATTGRVGRRLADNDILLLTTTGRATGRKHTVPLLYLREGSRLVVIASYGGRPNDPEWYRNLLATPQASVQILGECREIQATTMTDGERSEWWPKVVAAYSDYAVYQSRTDRQIPLIWLE